MLTIEAIAGDPGELAVDVLIVPLFADEPLAEPVARLDRALHGAVQRSVTAAKATKFLTTWSTLTAEHLRATRMVTVGLGPRGEWTLHRLRQAVGKGLQTAGQSQPATVGVALTGLPDDGPSAIEAAVQGLELAAWEYRGFYQTERTPFRPAITLVVRDGEAAEREGAVQRGGIVADAQNLVRELGWTPSSHLPPARLAEIAADRARRAGLEVDIFDEAKLAELKMGALLGVGQGSAHPPRLVVMRYRGGGDRTLALVGKGITFDSGGISLKPPAGMEEMKYDMLGAAAVLGAMVAIGRLRPRLDVVGLMAIAQNMPSGSAYKPGDVVTAFNGKSIEVINTDAEGRVALADAVSYAVHLGVDWIVEASTLTGAAITVLGHEATPLVATDDDLARAVTEAGAAEGERIWRLPAYPEYKRLYRSDVADLKNAPGRDAGTITGGMIIAEFAGDVPFAHLDIAGTAWTDSGPLNRKKGATGVMVRTFVRLAEMLGRE